MIPIIRPDVSFAEAADELRAVLDSGMLSRGPKVVAFEKGIADRIGVSHAIATTSATTALHLSLAAVGIGPGDEVLVSDFTFPASGNAIVQAGAVPVMVDCLPGRFDLDPDDAAAKVTPRTKAIMPVDPFGQPAELAAVHALARTHGLTVVEDSACALGAVRGGVPCGAWPGVGCFSFHPRKVLTTGEGGMVTTNDPEIARRAALLRNHGGETVDGRATFVANGFNYRMGEIQAALGIVQMRRLDGILEDRRRTAALYMERLAGALPEVAIPLSAPASDCTFQSFVVVLPETADRDAAIATLRGVGIETTLGTYAMHAHPAFARFGYRPGDLPNSHRMQARSLTLPLLPRMESAVVARVVDALKTALAESKKK